MVDLDYKIIKVDGNFTSSSPLVNVNVTSIKDYEGTKVETVQSFFLERYKILEYAFAYLKDNPHLIERYL